MNGLFKGIVIAAGLYCITRAACNAAFDDAVRKQQHASAKAAAEAAAEAATDAAAAQAAAQA